MSGQLPAPYELGGMTTEVFLEDSVIKTMVHPVSEATSLGLAQNLETYHAQMQAEPLPVPTITDITVVKSSRGYHVAHTMDLVVGPNLCSLKDEARSAAVKDALTKIALMATLPNGELLNPIDAKATNMHVDPLNGVTLVDLFPPLARHADGSYPLENIPQGQSAIRKRFVPYMTGTPEGAILRTLSTVVSDGARPLKQLGQLTLPIENWCYDVLPHNLSPTTKDTLRSAIKSRFFKQWVLATASGAAHQIRNKVGLPRYY